MTNPSKDSSARDSASAESQVQLLTDQLKDFPYDPRSHVQAITVCLNPLRVRTILSRLGLAEQGRERQQVTGRGTVSFNTILKQPQFIESERARPQPERAITWICSNPLDLTQPLFASLVSKPTD
jgi:hypothetical protein